MLQFVGPTVKEHGFSVYFDTQVLAVSGSWNQPNSENLFQCDRFLSNFANILKETALSSHFEP